MKIAFFDIKPDEIEYLEENLDSSFEKYYFQTSLTPEIELEDWVYEVEIISVFINSNLCKKVLSKFKNLKAIALRSIGYSHVDIVYANEKNIKIFNAPHYGDHSIAEYTFSLLLSISRKIVQSSYDVKGQIINNENYEGIELLGKTIGIIGLGATGKIVADIASGFSMKPIYYDVIKNDSYNFFPLKKLCEKSDIISINCPLNQNTLYMIDEEKFSYMKNGVIIINTARGEIIKTRALYEALISKKVKFAALDVVESENILFENIDNKVNIDAIKDICFKNYYLTRKLMSLENVLITPHVAYNTKEAKKRILEITVNNLNSSIKFTN